MPRRLLVTITCFALMAASALALDLTKIDRSLRKEPAYESKKPQYCLLVFGPEAKVRVWLVLDGNILYVDRNGDGDLTAAADRIAPLRDLRRSKERPDIEVLRNFWLPVRRKQDAKVAAGPVLSCQPDVNVLMVEQFVPSDEYPNKAVLKSRRDTPFDIGISTSTGWEQSGYVAFAARPQDAPILHFLGSQEIFWFNSAPLELHRGEAAHFLVRLRTPGLATTVKPFAIPKTARATAEIEFPAGGSDGAKIPERVELKEPGG